MMLRRLGNIVQAEANPLQPTFDPAEAGSEGRRHTPVEAFTVLCLFALAALDMK